MAPGDKYNVKDPAGPKVSPARTSGGMGKNVPVRQLVHLAWRMVTLGAAVFYVWASLRAGFTSILLLRGHIYKSMSFVPYEGHFLSSYLGPTTVRQSRIMGFIGNSTAPRDGTMYLESGDHVSFDGCSNVPSFDSWLFGDSYLRELWLDIGTDTSYKIAFFNSSELILPVVDCSFGSITSGDNSVARVYYLVRKKTDPEDVYVATVSISAQDYQLDDEHQYGAAGVVSMTFINGMSSTQVEYVYAARLGYPYQHTNFEAYEMIETNEEGFWVLESTPRDTSEAASKVIRTASRTGFYVHAETEQSNIKNLFWEQPQDPIKSMSVWQWAGRAVVRDSWAWVHGVHVLFAADTLMSILLLLIVVYQNMKKRKFWMGDAFISVTSTIEIRGLLILVTWYINGFWRVMEFCLMDANNLASFQRLEANAFMIRADLMTLYMCLAGLLGKIFRERVDPALVVFVFQIGFHLRVESASYLQDISGVLIDYAQYDYMNGMASILPKYTKVSPMRLWTIHPMVKRDLQFIFATLLLACGSFVFIITYLLIRKVYRRFVPETKVVWSRMTGQSTTDADSQVSFKSSLTVFEIATGVPLQNRVGLASDYDNCIYIKGMKFASPDGIFCNGYLIVNGKFLAATSDIPAIVCIVATKIRFKNVYVYEVHGHKVQRVARLVYPHTMSLKDLAHLNISILS